MGKRTPRPNAGRIRAGSGSKEPRPQKSRSVKKALLADRCLAERCLAGDVAAWEELYHQCHQPLCASIRILLGAPSDPNVVDEIAAGVWYAIVAEDGELLSRYDCKRSGGSRLVTFFRAVARNEVSRYRRAERRRRSREIDNWRVERERRSLMGEGLQAEADAASSAEMAEFLEGLTPSARQFFHDHLVSPDEVDESPAIAPTTYRQRRHRLRQKLLIYLQGGQ